MALLRSSARPKLAEPTGYDSPARAELALAIAARDELRRGIANLWEAEQRYDHLDYQDAVDRANAALGLAKTAATAHHLDSAQEGGTAVPSSDAIWQARVDLQVARDNADAARDAFNQLRPRREKMEQDAKQADTKVATAAAAVLREHPAIATILAEHVQVRAQYLESLGLLVWTDRHINHDGYGFRLETEQAVATDRALRQASGAPDAHATRPLTARWKAAYDALLTDARAPLPEDGRRTQ